MEITLYGKKTQIMDNFLTEVSIYNKFVQYAAEAREAYHTYYYNASSINEVIMKSRSVAYEQYKIVANKIINLLEANGITGITNNDILERHGFYAFDEQIKKLENLASDIDIQREREKTYRDYRKASRNRFIGGGFGVEGAIKGMAMASAANAATGAFHSVVNTFGNIGSSIKRSIAMDNLYHGGCGDILKAIDKDVMKFYYVSEEIFSENGFITENIPERIRQADSIYSQLENGTIPVSSQEDAVIRMITTFPGKFEYYALAVNLLGGSNGELKKLVEKFGLDTEYYMAIEASSEWRNLVFGDLKSKITKERHFPYLTKLLYSKWGYGVIPQLENGPVGIVSVLVSEFIQKFRSKVNIDECEFYSFENGNNGFLLALFESRNLKLSLNEIPILCLNISVQIAKSAKTAEYLLLTSDKLYFISKDGHINKASIQNINKIIFYDDEFGIDVNGTYFAPAVHFSRNWEYEFGGLIKSIIALIQCLQSVGHTNRSAAIIDKDSLLNDYDEANDISIYFKSPIDVLMGKYGDIHNIVLECVDGVYQNKTDSLLQKIEDLKKELSLSSDEEQRYEIKKRINEVNRTIQFIGTDRNLEFVEKNEIIIGIQSTSEVKIILTNKNLYLYFPPKTGKSNMCIELSQIKSAYYEWAFLSEAFWINDNEYRIISSDKNECKIFMSVLYWMLRYREEWEMHLSNKSKESSNNVQDDKISFEQATKDFKDVFSSYKDILLRGNLESLWRIAEEGDVLAEFVLEQFYKEKVLPYAIKKYDLCEMKSVLNIISAHATEGHPFGIFLSQSIKKSVYLANNQEGVNAYNISECNKIINQLEEECISLCAEKGFRIVESKAIEKEDGLLLLKKAAENYHPMAMAWYGSYLCEGLHRVRKNESLGRFYIELAVYAGEKYALNLNEKYGFSFEQYEEHIIPSKENFKFNNEHLQMKSFPRYLTEKYISRFMTQNKDVLFDENGLSESLQLINTKNSLAIRSDEIVFLAISACFFGHFKTSMKGLSITSKGIHINGGSLYGGVGFIDWKTLQDMSIFIRDGLNIDNFSLSCSPLEELLKELLLDLREITGLVLSSADMYEHQLIEVNNAVVEEVSGVSVFDNNGECEVTDSSICPKCGGYIKVNSLFCSKCGYQVIGVNNDVSDERTGEAISSDNSPIESITNSESVGIIKCSSCGKENTSTNKFCKYCGGKLRTTTFSTTGNPLKVETKVRLEVEKLEKAKKQDERKNNPKHLAIISLILGIISYLSILTIIIPITTSITGIVLGFKGLKSEKKKTAVAGIIINISFLVFFISILIFA